MSDYLNKNCETKNYKICQYKDNLPWDFLWDENSPLYKTGGWENENNKKEYTEIIKDIFSKPKYVKIFIVKTINSTLNIFFKFETGDTQLGVDQLRSPEGAINWHFKNDLREFWSSKQCNKILNFDEINNRQNIIIYTSFLVLILLFLNIKMFLKKNNKILFSVYIILISIISNAFICGTFSEVVPRYQSRVVWLIPLILLIFLFENFNFSFLKKIIKINYQKTDC